MLTSSWPDRSLHIMQLSISFMKLQPSSRTPGITRAEGRHSIYIGGSILKTIYRGAGFNELLDCGLLDYQLSESVFLTTHLTFSVSTRPPPHSFSLSIPRKMFTKRSAPSFSDLVTSISTSRSAAIMCVVLII